MKKPGIFQVCNNVFCVILILSLFSTVLISGFDAFTELLAACKSQGQNFVESLSLIQPHRTSFPN